MQKIVLGVILGTLGLASAMNGMKPPVKVHFDKGSMLLSEAQSAGLKKITKGYDWDADVDLKGTGILEGSFKAIVANLNVILSKPSDFMGNFLLGSQSSNDMVNAAKVLHMERILAAAVMKAASSYSGTARLDELIAAGISVDVVDENGDTPLIRACVAENKSMVQKLIAANVQLNIKGQGGKTALIVAAEKGHHSIVEELLKVPGNAVDANEVDNSGQTALMAACVRGESYHNYNKSFSLLIPRTNLDLQNGQQDTALLIASRKGYENMVKELLEAQKPASALIKDKAGKSALLLAIQGGHSKAATLLAERSKGIINEQDGSGRTPLSWAAAGGHSDCYDALVKNDAKESIKDAQWRTPFMIACMEGQDRFVRRRIIMGNSVDFNVRDMEGFTPLILASRKGATEIVQELLQGLLQRDRQSYNKAVDARDNRDRTALMWASYKGHTEVVNELLKHHADFQLHDNIGATALTLAAFRGHDEVVKILLEAKALVDFEENDGSTALLCASAKGHTKIVELLIKSHANVNKVDDEGNSSLALAARNGHLAVVKLLLGAGARVDHQDKKGRTAVLRACKYHEKDIVALLLNAGARVDLKDKRGNTALSLSTGQKEIEDLIRKGPKNKWFSLPRLAIAAVVLYVGHTVYKKYKQPKVSGDELAQGQLVSQAA